nr:uncharacterized protein LOC114925948 [Arachis hypogaea]
MENQRKESDAEEERSSKRTPLLSSFHCRRRVTPVVEPSTLPLSTPGGGSHRRALLPRSRRVLPPRVPSPSCLASVTANPPPLLPGPIAITVTGRKGRKRIECEGEEEFSSLLYVQLSLLLPIPPLLLHRRLRSSSPWPRSAVKSNVNGKENKEAANGDLEKWLCSVSASGFYKLPESSALIDPLKTPLNWRMRLQIANKVVAALEYLFLFNDPPAYHVSISSSNIMLDENFAAKIRKHFFSH